MSEYDESNRSLQNNRCNDISGYRPLNDYERETLIKNGNWAQSWSQIRVHEYFHPQFVSQCRFFGDVNIGALKEGFIEHDGFSLPIGLFNSTFMNCNIGHYSAINLLHYCSNCNIGSEVIIHNTGNILNVTSARFGNGAILPDDQYDQYNWLHLINENGGRKVLPFDTMICADAYIWAKYPQDFLLMKKLHEITNLSCSGILGCRGFIGHESVIKNVKSINNANIGNNSIVDGAELINNSTVHSNDLESTVIGTGVIISDSIIGYGNHISSGAQLHSVVTGCGVCVSQVSRISNSFIGDNSAIACCEIAHCLLFPSHGQHHNNSFLIAAQIGGQSNIAAGATIGSNHNSRMNDGEIWASRGFWPGLCTSFKHNSRFASYTMCVKADYPYELDIPFPFSLIINDASKDALLVLPAYWFSNNIYALLRSRYKFGKRDKRIHKDQIIEHDPLAPDTIEEIFSALSLLEQTAGEQWFSQNNQRTFSAVDCQKKGKELFQSSSFFPDQFELHNCSIEKSNRAVIIVKPAQAWKIYQDIVCWYAVRTITRYPEFDKLNISKLMPSSREKYWINCGGQIMTKRDLDSILQRIKTDSNISTWNDIHQLYKNYHKDYESSKFHYAASCLLSLTSEEAISEEQYKKLLHRAKETCKWMAQSTKSVRAKDFTDHFRSMVYEDEKELHSVLGSIEEDQIIQDIEQESIEMIEKINAVCNR